ncbi:Ig-like domain repeat protein (plasmid) [Kitasatospora sp. NBC_00070]
MVVTYQYSALSTPSWISNTSLPSAVLGSDYGSHPTTSIDPTGGLATPTFSATGLPQGLTIDPVHGAISGTPTGSPVTNALVTVTVSDGVAMFAQIFTITVGVGLPTTVITGSSSNPSGSGTAVTFTAAVAGGLNPTGSVTFRDADIGQNLGTVALDNGIAISAPDTSLIAVGDHHITATYNGDTNNFGSTTGTAFIQHVIKVIPGISVTSSKDPSKGGEAVTFTATVTGGSNPTGAVAFYDGDATGPKLGEGELDAGKATLDVNSLGIGDHTVTAVYGGDANNAGSSATVAQRVDKSIASVALTAVDDTTTYGEAASFTATVTGNGPTGSVTFTVDGIDRVRAVGGDGTAVLALGRTDLGAGIHSVVAVYGGDVNNAPSPASDTVTQTVSAADTSTTLTVTPTTVVNGQDVTLTATVTGNAPADGIVPVGTIAFYDGTVQDDAHRLGTPVSLVNGAATVTAGTLAPGPHTVTAVYTPGGSPANFTASTTGPQPVTVNQAPAFTSATAATFVSGAANIFTVTTTGYPAPAVSLSPSDVLPQGLNLVDNGDGTTTLAGTPAPNTGGTYTLHLGAANGTGTPASQSLRLTVNEPPALTSADNTAFTIGQSGVFPITTHGFPNPALTLVGSPPAGVTFTPNSDGTATLRGTPAGGTKGTYPLTIDATNVAGFARQAFTLTINGIPTTTSLAVTAPTTTVTGQKVTLTATVTNTPGNPGPAPTGTVTFKDGTTTLGTATISAGKAVLDTTALNTGPHNLTATHSPDSSHQASASSGITQTVQLLSCDNAATIPTTNVPAGYTLVRGTTGNDTNLTGTDGNDIILGLGGNDTVKAKNGSDLICTLTGNDQITTTGSGDDQINAGAGNNTIATADGNDQITTSDGNDTINAGNGNNTVKAGNGNNTISTGNGNDQITTGNGNDTINAGNGTDTANAGNGTNTIINVP